MGEYAIRKSDNERVKIGTCEDMYYLRFDQREQVKAESGNVDPIADATSLRFRFPFPDEDNIAPGQFEHYNRSVRIDGMAANHDVDHYTVQFSAHNGYLVSLPCPESKDTLPNVHKNGYGGAVHLVAQKLVNGVLVPILKCGGCGSMWRMEDRSEIEELAMRIRSNADAMPINDARIKPMRQIADRLLSGFNTTVVR